MIRSYQWVWLWNARSDKRWSCLWKLVFFEPGGVSESDKGCESSLRSVSSGGCSQLMRVSLHIHANQPSLHLDPSHLNHTVGNIRQYFLPSLKIRKYLCQILLQFDTSWLCLYCLCYTVRMPCYTKQRMVSVTAQYLLVPKVRMIFVTSVDFENDKSIFFHSATMLVSATPSFLQSSAFPKSRLKFWAVLFYVCLDPRS